MFPNHSYWFPEGGTLLPSSLSPAYFSAASNFAKIHINSFIIKPILVYLTFFDRNATKLPILKQLNYKEIHHVLWERFVFLVHFHFEFVIELDLYSLVFDYTWPEFYKKFTGFVAGIARSYSCAQKGFLFKTKPNNYIFAC